MEGGVETGGVVNNRGTSTLTPSGGEGYQDGGESWNFRGRKGEVHGQVVGKMRKIFFGDLKKATH